MTTPRTRVARAPKPTPHATHNLEKQPASKRKPATVKRPRISERDFQKQVIDLARTCGWLVEHKYGQGSVLGSRAIDTGFPDLVLVRGGQIIFAELKGSRGKVSEAQDRWLHALTITGNPALVWRPEDMDDIAAILASPASRLAVSA